MRGTDKGYIECLTEYNYVTFLFVVGRNTDIVPYNQCCQVPVLEGTGSRSGRLCNIYSDPNQHTLLRISSQSTQADEVES